MIFPLLNGWLGPARAPMTWLLIGLNVFMFSLTSRLSPAAQNELETVMRDDYFTFTQGRAYGAWVRARESEYPDFVRRLAERAQENERGFVTTLGQLAFRDEAFLEAADALDVDGDQVAVSIWKRRLTRLRAAEQVHPSFQLGLNAGRPGLSPWLTYIFVHSGFLHLLGNMIFLLIFGAALELELGGLGLLLAFTGGGMVAAGVFAALTGVTSSPLVGASGAVSAVMALFVTLNWSRPARFFWLALPASGYYGLTQLPAWIALGLWATADLAGYLGTLPELGGVAYTAHLGGDAAGILLGLALRAVRAPSYQVT